MKPRSTGRLVLALVASIATYHWGFVRALNAGGRVLGDWGIVPALIAFALVLTLLFTMVYDGPRAFGVLLRRRQPERL